MAKYRVIPIAMSIRGNKVAKAGDEVNSDQLIDEKQSLKDGYVELLGDSEEEEIDETDETDETDDVVDIESLTKQELIKYAADNEMDIDKSGKKKDIKAEILNQL